MRITLAYNLRKTESEEESELLREEEVERLYQAIKKHAHTVTKVEVSGTPGELVENLVNSRPELIFNVAEGLEGKSREAYYPAVYEQLGIPYTGGGSSLLYVNLDKRLSEKILDQKGIPVPKGVLITEENPEIPEVLPYPLIIKPNYEGTSKGIYQKSIVENREEAEELIQKLLPKFPQGLDVEQYIMGRELTVPMLEAYPGKILEIVEHSFEEADGKYDIYDYKLKQSDDGVKMLCPPELSPQERQDVLSIADRAYSMMPCPDLGRVDIRLHEDGTPYFIEVNALPRLQPDGSLIIAAKEKGVEYDDVIRLVIESAARRYGLVIAPKPHPVRKDYEHRPTCREQGLTIGIYETGEWNSITDVAGVNIGHVTHIKDDVPVPGKEDLTTTIRTGITAVVPETGDLFNNHLVAGGFVLNGIGEMSGMIQAMEWGWLETPILLTNTMSVGRVHAGIIDYMIKTYPELGRKVEVIIPLIGETNDAFLNDARIQVNTPEEAIKAIHQAQTGPIEQGSVGAGTGMISFDFSGGIGTSSRVLERSQGGYTVGVLAQSNFGKMHNLTIEGAVVGRELDTMYPYEGRQEKSYGSVIIIVATDAPLLSTQLDRLSKRAALGIGRTGSYAAATSGEMVFAFSTANRTSREAKEYSRSLNLTFITDEHINSLYEAVIEATEEAILNAMFCSNGMSGRKKRYAPPLPAETVFDLLGKGRTITPPGG